MIYYILWLVVAMAWYLFADRKTSKSTPLLFVYLLALGLFVGLGDMLGGYDRYIYGELFDRLADDVANNRDLAESLLFQQYPKELGYNFLNVAISYITPNRYIFIFILTMIVYALLFVSLRDYTDNYPFAVVLFLGLWFFFTFTYLRQVLGVTTAWLAIRYAIKKQFWLYLLVFALAVLMHNSALIFFPVYFLASSKLKPPTILAIMGVCFVIGLTGIPANLFEIYGETAEMQKRVVPYTEITSGFRFEYVMEAAVFLFFILTNYSSVPGDRRHLVFLNMALAFCGILLLFVRSENGGRLGWYYMIGLISTFSFFAARVRVQSYYKPALMLLSALLFFRILTQWGILLYPYKTFLTDGYRNGDFIYMRYEYDHNYDEDKLYK